ncbi:hypothetical protein N7492_003910 [Penicillium capsulatum]|uniref:FAD-binding domain-containing protein n=1 Tax=Penicillium capsulatum TaxID=69766 RepID=A0A9W9LX04_9EURO|nr:hypothetical protein N7492_003910 [Penicillium capsulatum]KAJ6121510.1 hypothetical protein N7512_003975 [Penicillium capsulatum]
MALPVLIIGSGLGGVCLAQALHKNHIPFKLFEQDQRHNLRTQGYRLRITGEGVSALEDALTPELFSLYEKTCADWPSFGVRINGDGTPAGPPGRPGPPPHMNGAKAYTVDRATFREALLTGLDDHVAFGKHFNHYTIHDDKVVAHFADGSTQEGSLLVGADGVRSRVRRQYLPDYQGIDTGMRLIYGKTPITPEFLAAVPEDFHHGMSLVTNGNDLSQPTLLFEPIHFPRSKEITRPQLPDPYVYWVLIIHHSNLPSSNEQSWQTRAQDAAHLARHLTSSWIPSLRAIFDMQDASQSSIRSILSAPPDIPAWEPSQRVTLLGDALHVMPPTGAMGANTALRDAADLARRIIAVGGAARVDCDTIGAYEASLREFAKMAIEASWRGGKNSFGLSDVEECEVIKLD